MKKKLFSILKVIVFLSIGVLLIWLSIRGLSSSQRSDIIESFASANYFWVTLAVICGLLSHLVRANRWRRLLKPMGYNPGLKNIFLATMIGYLANYAIPRLGEVSRCGILTRTDKIPMNKSLGTVVTERAFDLFIFIIIFIVTIFIEHKHLSAYLNDNIYPKLSDKFAVFSDGILWYVLLVAGAVLIGLYFVFRTKLRTFKLVAKIEELFKGFFHGLKSLFKIEKPLLFLLETLAIWVFYLLMPYLCFFSLSETSHLSINAGLSALVIGSIGIMITPGGIGIFPILIQETLKLYAIAKITGLALGWIIWTTQTVMILLVGGMDLIIVSFNKTMVPNLTSDEKIANN